MRLGYVIALVLGFVSSGHAQRAYDPFGPSITTVPAEPKHVLPAVPKSNSKSKPYAESSSDDGSQLVKAFWIGATADEDQAVRERMKQETKIQFIETPLEEVVGYLKNLHGFNIVISPRVYEQIGPPHEVTVTLNIEGIRLDSALNYLLKSLELDWYIHDEMLVITTADVVEKRMTLRAYPLRNVDGGDITQLLESTANPDSWKANGGQGQMKLSSRNILFVWQNRHGHELVEATIDMFQKNDFGALK